MKKGLYTALVTPFAADGSVDLNRLDSLVEAQLSGGASGVVVLGTTGEAPALTFAERDLVVLHVVNKFKGRLDIVAGCGSFNTSQASELARRYSDMGADSLLSVTPYYNKPDDEGMYAHFCAVADAAGAPVVVYNVPSRTGSCVSTGVLKRLRKHGNIAGVKEASGNVSYLAHVCALSDDKFSVWCGNDDIILPALSLGAVGAVSVWSNLMPDTVSRLLEAFFSGDVALARRIQLKWLELIDALFADTNPLPVKAALEFLGCGAGCCRLPLKDLKPENREHLRQLLAREGLI